MDPTPDTRRGDFQDLDFGVTHPLSEGLQMLDAAPFEAMLRTMRCQVSALNANSMVRDNGYTYPVEWLDRFEAKLRHTLERYNTSVASTSDDQHALPEKPEVRIFGYGSLGTVAGRAHTKGLAEASAVFAKTDCSEVFGKSRLQLHRKIDMAGVTRMLKLLPQVGVARLTNLGTGSLEANRVNADEPYEAKSEVVGVLIEALGLEQLQSLSEREFSYFLLPGPPVDILGTEGGRCELSLLCWPIGRELIEEGYSAQDGSVNTFAREQFYNKLSSMSLRTDENFLDLSGDDLHTLYKAYRLGSYQTLLLETGARNLGEGIETAATLQELATRQEGVLDKLFSLVDSLYSLDRRIDVRPNAGYVLSACLGFGKVSDEYRGSFLDYTTFRRDGEDMPIRTLLSEIAEVIDITPEVLGDLIANSPHHRGSGRVLSGEEEETLLIDSHAATVVALLGEKLGHLLR